MEREATELLALIRLARADAAPNSGIGCSVMRSSPWRSYFRASRVTYLLEISDIFHDAASLSNRQTRHQHAQTHDYSLERRHMQQEATTTLTGQAHTSGIRNHIGQQQPDGGITRTKRQQSTNPAANSAAGLRVRTTRTAADCCGPLLGKDIVMTRDHVSTVLANTHSWSRTNLPGGTHTMTTTPTATTYGEDDFRASKGLTRVSSVVIAT